MAWSADDASREELIVQAIVTLLEANGGPSSLLVHRFRGTPINKDSLPASIVYPMQDPAKPDTHDVTVERTLTIVIEHRVEVDGVSPSNTSPDEELDPLRTWAHYQLLTDRTLGGLCTDVRDVNATWDAGELDKLYGACAQVFEIDYEHDEGDMTTLNGA